MSHIMFIKSSKQASHANKNIEWWKSTKLMYVLNLKYIQFQFQQNSFKILKKFNEVFCNFKQVILLQITNF